MTYSKPAETTTAELARTVADEGRSVVGILDRPFSRCPLRAVDEAAARFSGAGSAGEIRQLSGLAQNADLAAIVDWAPLLAVAVELLTPIVYSHPGGHAPHPPTGGHRWHRDNGPMGRDMRVLWRDQPRVTLKVTVYLTDVESPDDAALEVVPCTHLDTDTRYPIEEQSAGVHILGPAGTVAVFGAGLWHRRRDNLGTHVRRVLFTAYSDRWLASRDIPFENVPAWASLSPVRRQLLGDRTVDPFYWASGELPPDPRSTGLREAA